jgi:phytoene synthase
MPETVGLTASYAYCRRTARLAARNFYYGFLLLPREKRDALCALYAFMRHSDDLSDGAPGEGKGMRLAAWRVALERALQGSYGTDPVLPAFHDAVVRYDIPPKYFRELIDGMEMDLTIGSYATFDELKDYCYRVAGTVGLSCLHVFGSSNPQAEELAENLGIAFQLTNILRDVSEDLAMGRVYLPQEDLARFACDADLMARALTPALVALMRFEAERAWQFYRRGTPLLEAVSPDSRPALWALIRIYTGVLTRIENLRYDVFARPRVGLSAAEKLWVLARARVGSHQLCLPAR